MDSKKTQNYTENNIYSRKRTLSRLMAAQILYQFEFFEGAQNIIEIKNNLIDNYILQDGDNEKSYRTKIDEELIDRLLKAVELNHQTIDEDIFALRKKTQEIDGLMMQIMRLAATELKFAIDVPAKVIIDEYVGITASFFDDHRLSFVNSILENLTKQYRELEYNELKQL